MSVKISQLTASNPITSDDFFPVVDSGSLTTLRASAQQILNYVTGSTFNNLVVTTITASQQLIQGDLRVLGTASITQLNTIGQTSLLIGDKYITILSGGVDHAGINGAGFLWGSSSGPGETTGALGEHAHILYDSSRDALEVFPGLYVTGSTTLFEISGTTARFTTVTSSNVTGTLARFTTVSSSNLVVSGGNAIFYEQAVIGDNAYVLFNAGIDKLVAFPGLYVTGAITASTVVSAPTGIFTTISGTNVLSTNLTGTIARFTEVTASSFAAALGTVSSPSYDFVNDPNTGIWSPAADTLAISTNGVERFRINSSGNTILTGNLTVVGTVSASSYLGVSGSGGSGTPGGTNTTIQFNSGSTFSGSSNLTWNYTSNVLSITGSLVATTKSFDIVHPLNSSMRLRYGSLEGPENGVYVRGKTKEKVIQLPEYWINLVDEATITVNLTPIGSHQQLWVEKVENNTVLIGGELVECYFTVFAERKDVDKLVVEY